MELSPLLTTGAGAGLFVWLLVWIIKFLFDKPKNENAGNDNNANPNSERITKKERWILFILIYIPVIALLFYVTMKGGKQDPQTQPYIKKGGNAKQSSIIDPLRFLVTDAYAGAKMLKTNYPDDNCGVTTGEYIVYKTFNDDAPFFVSPGHTSLRIVLIDLDVDKEEAKLEINDNGKPLPSNTLVAKAINKSTPLVFDYQKCKFKITYTGYDSFFIWYLLRQRYYVKIKIDKI